MVINTELEECNDMLKEERRQRVRRADCSTECVNVAKLTTEVRDQVKANDKNFRLFSWCLAFVIGSLLSTGGVWIALGQNNLADAVQEEKITDINAAHARLDKAINKTNTGIDTTNTKLDDLTDAINDMNLFIKTHPVRPHRHEDGNGKAIVE